MGNRILQASFAMIICTIAVGAFLLQIRLRQSIEQNKSIEAGNSKSAQRAHAWQDWAAKYDEEFRDAPESLDEFYAWLRRGTCNGCPPDDEYWIDGFGTRFEIEISTNEGIRLQVRSAARDRKFNDNDKYWNYSFFDWNALRSDQPSNAIQKIREQLEIEAQFRQQQ